MEIDLSKLKPDADEVYSKLGEDPAKYLLAFLAMSKSPKRYEIGFQRADLGWIAKAWKEAAIATDKGLLREMCLRESERYEHLRKNLEAGELDRREEGTVLLDSPSDWPRPEVIKAAITALSTAGIRTLQ